jgi:IS5 family transposase
LFLEQMEQVVPWKKLCRLIEPYYPKAGNGRPPVGLERMLRIYFLQ